MIDYKAGEQYEIVPIDKLTTADFLKQYPKGNNALPNNAATVGLVML